MIIEEQTETKGFQSLLEALREQFTEADMLHKVRAKAWEHFLGLGLPTRKEEAFRYIRLNYLFSEKYQAARRVTLESKDIAKHILPECENSVLVFVNGYFSPLLSNTTSLPAKIVVTSLNEAMRTYGGFLNSQFTKIIKEETDPFAAVNTALHPEGLFIYLPPKTTVEIPIQLLNIIDSQDSPMAVMPRLQIFVGAQSELNLVSTQGHLSKNKCFFNMVVDAALEENAHIKYTQVACGIPENLWHFDALRASLKRNSTLKSYCFTDGAATVRHDYRTSLIGENADVHLNGMWLLNDENQSHTHIVIDHQAPHCQSMQLFKGVLGGSSRSSFEGKILVRQAAQKTEAFQLNNNLLLSNRAHADSKPNLEIFADDVKASHGATVGQLDPEHIFYMKTRGFSEEMAKGILVYGFCQEIIDLIEIASVREAMKLLLKSIKID